jgi:hypothetical protein
MNRDGEHVPVLEVIIAARGPSGRGYRVARWIAEHAAKTGGVEVEIVDLAELDLLMLDESYHPGARDNSRVGPLSVDGVGESEWSAVGQRAAGDTGAVRSLGTSQR